MYFNDFFNNNLLIAPFFAWLIAQVLKLITYACVEKKFRLERLFGDGGMPSGHSATVTSLAVICGWECGFGSPLFAISVVLAIIVMHDASGVRLETGKQNYTIKQIADVINAMFADPDQEVRTEKLKEFVGHTPLQVIFGSLLGATVGIVYILVSHVPYGSFPFLW